MRTQEQVNYYFQSFAVKSAIELVKIESILEVNKVQLPNNIIIHKNGIDVSKFLNWWQNKSNPKTYKECCDVLVIPPYYDLVYYTCKHGYNEYAKENKLLSLQNKLNILGKILICRDAYWKIAGEQMGLGKSWEPNWMDETTKYGIGTYQNDIFVDNVVHTNRILVFPTEKMRDAFYGNFRDLIEDCKELL